jgi:hypothetical protein
MQQIFFLICPTVMHIAYCIRRNNQITLIIWWPLLPPAPLICLCFSQLIFSFSKWIFSIILKLKNKINSKMASTSPNYINILLISQYLRNANIEKLMSCSPAYRYPTVGISTLSYFRSNQHLFISSFINWGNSIYSLKTVHQAI